MSTAGRRLPLERWVPLIGGAVFALLLVLNSERYYPFLSDDALISLRYAARLLDGKGLTWASGPAVEGYSNLLWVLTTAAFGSLGVDLVWAARGVGVSCMVLTATLVCAPRRGRTAVVPILAVSLMACMGPIAAWAIGGLEQPMVAVLVIAALVAVFRLLDEPETQSAPKVAGLAFAGLCLTRPDSPLFVAATFAGLLASPRARRVLTRRHVAWLIGVPASAVLAQLAFRLAYYGEWVPNTALVKVSFTPQRLTEGIAYVTQGWADLRPFADIGALALVVGIARPESRVRCVLLAANICAWLAYVVVIGGDVLPGRRHFVVVIALMTLAIVEGLGAMERRATPVMLAGLALLAYLTADSLWEGQPRREAIRNALTERWEWHCGSLALMLRDAFKRDDALVAVSAAGCIPYWSELDAIDMLGLNDHHIAHHPPPSHGKGWLGHDLGDGGYVLGREPDLIVFDLGGRPRYRSGEDMKSDPRFVHGYQEILFATTSPTRHSGYFYVRRHSPRIGIRSVDGALWVPGFLLQAEKDVVVNGRGALGGRLEAGETGFIELDRPVRASALRVQSEPPGAVEAFVDPNRPTGLTLRVTRGARADVEGVRIEQR